MDRRRILCGLRIAWSVWWGIVCVLFVVLWVRSYWIIDSLRFHVSGSRYFHVQSVEGHVVFLSLSKAFQWRISHVPILLFEGNDPYTTAVTGSSNSIALWAPTDRILPAVPHGCLVIAIVILGVLPWLSWSFSLRTL